MYAHGPGSSGAAGGRRLVDRLGRRRSRPRYIRRRATTTGLRVAARVRHLYVATAALRRSVALGGGGIGSGGGGGGGGDGSGLIVWWRWRRCMRHAKHVLQRAVRCAPHADGPIVRAGEHARAGGGEADYRHRRAVLSGRRVRHVALLCTKNDALTRDEIVE